MTDPGPSTKRHKPEDIQLPWVEKYRPKTLEDMVGNDETIERLRIIARDGNTPHMIISGAPGIGKTISALCLAHELLGDKFKEGVLELNASDSRGIDVVRGQIKQFAQKKVDLPPGVHKLVILDEADSMTPGAQQALRRTMEIYSHTTRFIFACNQSSKIIEPLQSRCALLRFAKLSNDQVAARLRPIIAAEGVDITEDGLSAILFTAEGDMRQAINNLESTHAAYGKVTAETVFKIVDQPHPVIIAEMIEAAQKSDINKALDILSSLWEKGYSVNDIITTMFRVTKNASVGDEKKLDALREIGLVHVRIIQGVGSKLQLAGLLSKLSLAK